MRGHKFLKGTRVKVLYDADEPQIEGKIGVIKSYPNFVCSDYWYDVKIDGKLYNCCSSQLTYC